MGEILFMIVKHLKYILNEIFSKITALIIIIMFLSEIIAKHSVSDLGWREEI